MTALCRLFAQSNGLFSATVRTHRRELYSYFTLTCSVSKRGSAHTAPRKLTSQANSFPLNAIAHTPLVGTTHALSNATTGLGIKASAKEGAQGLEGG